MISTAAAARTLGVTEVQVRDSIAAGVLVADVGLGGAWDVDPLTLRSLQRSRGRGRRWSEATAWAALELLTDGRTQRIGPSQRSRLRARLAGMTVAELAYRAEGRGRLRRMQQLNGTRTDLLRAVRTSGASALDNESIRRAFDLAEAHSPTLIAYVPTAGADVLDEDFALVPNIDGDILLRVSADPLRIASLIALDLYCYGDSRESAAGRRWLEEAIRGL